MVSTLKDILFPAPMQSNCNAEMFLSKKSFEGLACEGIAFYCLFLDGQAALLKKLEP